MHCRPPPTCRPGPGAAATEHQPSRRGRLTRWSPAPRGRLPTRGVWAGALGQAERVADLEELLTPGLFQAGTFDLEHPGPGPRARELAARARNRNPTVHSRTNLLQGRNRAARSHRVEGFERVRDPLLHAGRLDLRGETRALSQTGGEQVGAAVDGAPGRSSRAGGPVPSVGKLGGHGFGAGKLHREETRGFLVTARLLFIAFAICPLGEHQSAAGPGAKPLDR